MPHTVANQRVETGDKQQRDAVTEQDHSEEIGAFLLFAWPDLTADEDRL